VSGRPEVIERLEAFLQEDVAVRNPRWRTFLADLRAVVAAGGPEAARPWARRAVSPLADYGALLALAPFLGGAASPEPLRLAILGGPTTAQLRRLVEVFLAGEGIPAEIFEGDFGLFRQEILTPGSALDVFRPQVVFLATGARDVARTPTLDLDTEAVARMAEAEVDDWALLWATANRKWNATVVQNNFEIAPGGVLGHLALRHPAAREHWLERLNGLMAQRAPAFVALHDLRGLAAEAGARAWYDARFYFEFRMPCGADCLVTYAHSVVAVLRAILGRSRKVLVLDLDNTLWGGVVGDAGAGGIHLGEGSGEGEAHLSLQRHARELRERGVLLAVCSKNDEAKAREPFEKRPDMVLGLGDFACFIANWENKADNLRTIARTLNLQLEALVLVDDNPAERALVRRLAPEVGVPDLPDDAAGYVQALAACRYFETVALTREDAARARYYADNARREALAAGSTDLGAFLASLGMRMAVAPVDAFNLERATQLINKSNQFNLTTRRYPVAQVRELAASPDWLTLTFSLRDALGDHGLISVLLARRDGDALDLDTWVMSCRVLQRGVEHFVRDELVAAARREGLGRIRGRYLPSARNGMVEDLFGRLGFGRVGTVGEEPPGASTWSLPIRDDLPPLPHAIERD
jgi:FkbH-like protein